METVRTTGKMQEIVDRAMDRANKADLPGAISAIVEAVQLLSRGVMQVMDDQDRPRFSPSDTRIGSDGT